MCLAIPGKVVSVKGDNAVVDFDGVQKEVNISLVGNLKIGEYLVIHAGFAIQKMGEGDAIDILNIYEESKKNKKDTRANMCGCGRD